MVEIDNSKTRMIAADAEDAVTAKAKATEDDTETAVLDDEDVDVDLGDDILDDEEKRTTCPWTRSQTFRQRRRRLISNLAPGGDFPLDPARASAYSPAHGSADPPLVNGALAQLGERLHGMQEVSGSIPLCSTKPHHVSI